MCTWNQRIIFFDLSSMDQMNLWIKLINLEVHQEVLGEIHIDKLTSTNKSEWYHLTGWYSPQQYFILLSIFLFTI